MQPFTAKLVNRAFSLLALTTFSMAASGSELEGYLMSIQANVPGSKYLQAGEYEKAITASRAVLAQPGWQTAAQNNLCVTYTILKDYQRARRACVSAVKLSRTGKAWQRSPQRQDMPNLAMAYSNRGVLRALQDDFEGANQDFIKAKKYASDTQRYAQNHALLQWNLSINGSDKRISAN